MRRLSEPEPVLVPVLVRVRVRVGVLVPVLVLGAACHPSPQLRGSPGATSSPSSPSLAPSLDDNAAPSNALALPVVGATHAAQLHDGWPVWIVRHSDGSVSVLDAVGPPRVRTAPLLFAPRSALVQWVAASRRLLAGDVVYDEWGHVLGYATTTLCFDTLDDCPRVAEPALDQRALDRFSTTIAGDRVLVGDRYTPAPLASVSAWVDYDHVDHVARDLALAADAMPVVALDAARTRPLGTYAIVVGSLVRSTDAAPRLCACGACDARSPAVVGLAPVPIDQPATESESGTWLVRRDAAGLAVLAMNHARACPRR